VWWLLVALLFCTNAGKLTATGQGEKDSRVQELYAEAKSAQAAGDLNTAVQRYEAILKASPQLAAAYNNLGSIYIQQREFRKAADVLKKGLTINPSMSSASALLGLSLYELREYGEAEPQLASALRANPKDNNVELYLARTLMEQGKLDQAATHLRAISQREPRDQEVLYLLGKIYMQLSEQSLTKLSEIDPESYLVHQVSGEVMESMNNLDGALLEYKKAVDIAPQKSGTHYHLANAYWSLLMWEPAKKEFLAELQNDPNNCEAHWKLGNIQLEQQSEPESALEEENKALAICPSSAAAHSERGRALLKMEHYQEAVEDLKQAAAAEPNDPRAHFMLAQAYRGLGRANEAQSEMRTFSKLQEAAQAAKANHAKQVLENKETAPTP
jgi:tetratricopeptide (TPR) repeat protein